MLQYRAYLLCKDDKIITKKHLTSRQTLEIDGVAIDIDLFVRRRV